MLRDILSSFSLKHLFSVLHITDENGNIRDGLLAATVGYASDTVVQQPMNEWLQAMGAETTATNIVSHLISIAWGIVMVTALFFSQRILKQLFPSKKDDEDLTDKII